MKFNQLGNTGVNVSELCFGTMSFGGDADEALGLGLGRSVRARAEGLEGRQGDHFFGIDIVSHHRKIGHQEHRPDASHRSQESGTHQ